MGIEIRTSNNHTIMGNDGKAHPFLDICDTLAGRYPKDFKFTGWHPLCRCHAVTILKTEEEMAKDTENLLSGGTVSSISENTVTDVPQAFKEHIEKNEKRIRSAENGRLPYYMQDNRGMVNKLLGIEQNTKKTALEIADERHKARTKMLVENILKNWNKHEQILEDIRTSSKIYRQLKSMEHDSLNRLSVKMIQGDYIIIKVDDVVLRVHRNHGTNELMENIKVATDRAKRHGYKIDLIKKNDGMPCADSFNRTLNRTEEYKVNRVATRNAIDRLLRDGSKQSTTIVLYIDSDIPLKTLKEAIQGRTKRCARLHNVIIVYSGKETSYTRNQILSGLFQIKEEDFK